MTEHQPPTENDDKPDSPQPLNPSPESEQTDRDWWTAEAMRQKGGGFVRALGNAYAHGDPDNARRIQEAWPEYWSKYEKTGEVLRTAERAKEDN